MIVIIWRKHSPAVCTPRGERRGWCSMQHTWYSGPMRGFLALSQVPAGHSELLKAKADWKTITKTDSGWCFFFFFSFKHFLLFLFLLPFAPGSYRIQGLVPRARFRCRCWAAPRPSRRWFLADGSSDPLGPPPGSPPVPARHFGCTAASVSE